MADTHNPDYEALLRFTEEDIENAYEAMQEGEWQWFQWLFQQKVGPIIAARVAEAKSAGMAEGREVALREITAWPFYINDGDPLRKRHLDLTHHEALADMRTAFDEAQGISREPHSRAGMAVSGSEQSVPSTTEAP